MKITKLEYDRTLSCSRYLNSENCKAVSVGINDVIKIEEHRAAGEGDKWYYDIHYSDGTIKRTFNPSNVYYAPDLIKEPTA